MRAMTRRRRRPCRLALLAWLCLLALAHSGAAVAAEVVQVTGRTAGSAAGEAFVKLAQGEALAAGDRLTTPGGRTVEVVEVVGQRARVRLSPRGRLRKGDQVQRAAAQAGAGTARPRRATARAPKQAWKIAPAATPASANVALWPTLWRRLRTAERKLIAARQQGRGPATPGQPRGDLTFVGVGLLPVGANQGWASARLGSRVQWPGLAGLPLDYRHELSLYLDSIGADQGGRRARRPLEVRRMRLAMAVSPARPWGGRLGRIVVGDGAGGQLVDGAATSLRLGQQVEIEAYGGMGPDLVSLAPRFDAARFGAGATWTGRLFGDQALASLAWGGQLFNGALDRQVLGSRLHLTLPWVGRIDGQFDAALQQPDARGHRPPLQPHRAWLGIAGPSWGGWRPRLRYSYYRAISSRELRAAMAWATLPASQQHDIYLQMDSPHDGGWWWTPALWGGHRAGADKLDGFRVGGTVRAGVSVGRWSWHGSVGGQSPLSPQAEALLGGALRGGSVGAGGRWQTTDALAVSARLSGHMDEVLPIGSKTWRVGSRLGVDWARGPWLVDLGLGLDKGLTVDAPWRGDAVDWLDLTAVVRRSF